jgi:hypothetical protein
MAGLLPLSAQNLRPNHITVSLIHSLPAGAPGSRGDLEDARAAILGVQRRQAPGAEGQVAAAPSQGLAALYPETGSARAF